MDQQSLDDQNYVNTGNSDLSTYQSARMSVVLNDKLNVIKRLDDLAQWKDEYISEDQKLKQIRDSYSLKNQVDIRIRREIARQRRAIQIMMVKKPFEVSVEVATRVGISSIRTNLTNQYSQLSVEQKKMWLNNLTFILTPEMIELDAKINRIRKYRSLGQSRCFLLAGDSGSGKTTFINWYCSMYPAEVTDPVNRVKVIKFDAPVNNRSSIDLYRRLMSPIGFAYRSPDYEEDYLDMALALIDACEAELVIVDEVQHIKSPEIRRRLLELSNLTSGIPFLCASVNPHSWVEGDPEVEGRWNDNFILSPYTGSRLRQLLTFIELFLPFPLPSNLNVINSNSLKRDVPTPLHIIEQKTKGILRDIMVLVWEASNRAIDRKLDHLPPELLLEAWKDIQRSPVRKMNDED